MSSTTPLQGGGAGSTAQEGAGQQSPGRRQGTRHNSQGHHGRTNGRDNRGSRGNNQQGTRLTGATSELKSCTFGIHNGYSGAKKYSNNIKKLKIYVFKNFTTDLGLLFGKSPAMPTVKKPVLTEEAKKDQSEVEMHRLKLKEYMEVKRKMVVEVKKMYAIILGQCTEAMLNKIKASRNYEEMNDEGNVIWLLTEIRKITYLSDEKEDPFISAVGTASRMYRLVQEQENLANYYDTWTNMAEVLKHKGSGFVGRELIEVILKEGGTLLGQNVAIKLNNEQPFNKSELKKYKKAKHRAEERYLAALFIKGLRGNKFLRMKTELANQCSWGSNSYPSTVTEAYNMAMAYKSPDGNSCGRDSGNRIEGLSFITEKEYRERTGSYGSTPPVSGATNQATVPTFAHWHWAGEVATMPTIAARNSPEGLG